MNITRLLNYFLLTTLLGAGLSVAGMVHASERVSTDDSTVSAANSGELYLPSEDAMADLSAALDAARNSNRLLRVMMGANCGIRSKNTYTRMPGSITIYDA